jgi:hypothetical protein
MQVKIEIILMEIKHLLKVNEPYQLVKSYTTLSQLKRRLLS